MSFLNLENIAVSYNKGESYILKGLNLSINEGELVSLLGPSGCGKTTTLRVIAGFIEPAKGDFILEGNNLTKVPVHKRNFGLVFQSYALFPHYTVRENIAFGLKLRKLSKNEIEEKVNKMIKVCDLNGLSERYPKQLSGGQRQRVALARALVIEPKLLLLDEPLSNLDAKLRVQMRVEIKRLQKELGITTIFVTHDQEECFAISDKVAVMNGGVIEQYDRPEVIYKSPSTEFVARFIGFENFIDLERVSSGVYKAINGSLFEVGLDYDLSTAKATIRPDDIEIKKDVKNTITGIVNVRTFLGKAYQYEVETELGRLIVNSYSEKVYKQGEEINLYLPSQKIVLVK